MKKLTILSVVVLLFSCGLRAGSDQSLDSGYVRVAKIMNNAETGIAAYNKKNIRYAEALNLDRDLNVSAIVEFFGCKTAIGRTFMAQTLLYPVSSEDQNTVLMRRQQAIRALVENPNLRKQIGDLLAHAQQQEQDVLKLMSDYFIGTTSPELQQLEVMKKQNAPLAGLAEFLVINPTLKKVGTVMNWTTLPVLLVTSAMSAYSCASNPALIPFTAYMAGLTGVTGYTTYQDYTRASEKRNTIHALSQFVTIAETLENLCTENGVQTQFSLKSITDPNGLRLIEKLKHARYQEKNTRLFFTPVVHLFLYEIYREDKNLSSLFACIAEMDTCHAIATKVAESQTEKNKFCFSSFLTHPKPVIHAKGFWNVLVKEAVTNNIGEEKHMILTGPNAGGKSTAIRALLQNILLSQTFGVAAAESFDFTMFDIIHSYLNISDDLINGLSLFASEVKRAQELLQCMQSLEPGKKFFFALDELFTGTVAEDGEQCAFNFVQKIAGFENTLFIYATHFNKLKELGDNNAYCCNYKVDAPTKNDNKLVYPFTLSQGASQVNVGLDIAQQAGLFA